MDLEDEFEEEGALDNEDPFDADAALIAEVKLSDALFDLKHADYRDSKKKDLVWLEIGKVLGRDPADCKKSWKKLKDKYIKITLAERKRNYSGAGGSKNIKKWAHFDLMRSFLKVQQKRKTTSNVPDDPNATKRLEKSLEHAKSSVWSVADTLMGKNCGYERDTDICEVVLVASDGSEDESSAVGAPALNDCESAEKELRAAFIIECESEVREIARMCGGQEQFLLFQRQLRHWMHQQ